MFAEALARRADDIDAVDEQIEQIPRFEPIWALQPDIRRVHASVGRKAGGREPLADNLCIVHVIADRLFDLRLARLGVDGLRAALYNIGHAVEFRSLSAGPVTVEAHAVSGKLFWDDGVGAAGAGEPRGISETP